MALSSCLLWDFFHKQATGYLTARRYGEMRWPLFLPDCQFNKGSPTFRCVKVVNDIDRQTGRGSRSWMRAAAEDWL